jgi:hypothetical protein
MSEIPSETPEELHARAVDALRMPPVEEWEEVSVRRRDATARPPAADRR